MILTYRKSLVILPLLFALSHGADVNIGTIEEVGDKSGAYTDEARDNAGMKQQQSADGKTKTDEIGQIDDTLMDVVVYNDILEGRSHHQTTRMVIQPIIKGNIAGVILASPATDLALASSESEKLFQAEEAKRLAIKAKEESEIPSYFIGGYCTVNTPVKIIRNSEFTVLNCLLDFGNGEFRDADVFAGVYPNFTKETLTVLPIYATFKNQNKVSLDGVVLTEDKGSLNIADHVENFKIRELIAEYGLATNDVAYRYASAYMAQTIASQSQTKVDYISIADPSNPLANTVVPVVTSQTQPPSSTDYFAMAGIELLSKIISIGAKNMLEDTSPLFRIYKGKRVYLEGVVSSDAKGLGRKYGRIATEEKANIQKENSEWSQKNTTMINKYDASMQQSRDGAQEIMTNSARGNMNTAPTYPTYPTQYPTQYPTTVPR